VFAAAIVPCVAAAQGGAHQDPVTPVLAALAAILVSAKLGGDLAARIQQPAVLGELLAGVVLGNVGREVFPALARMATDPTIDMLSRLGVIVLLFEVGLESTVGEMARVGLSATLVAVIGVAVPMLLGWGAGAWLLPGESRYVHAFLGATLSATSVGITARVLKDLGRSRSPEAQIIVGAAVVDDVLGLVVLAVVSGTIEAAAAGRELSWASVGSVLGKAALFLAAAIAIGLMVSRRLYAFAARLRGTGLLLPIGLAFCFAVAWAAGAIGLAPIIGAFAAGLVFEEAHASPLVVRGEHPLARQIEPVAAFLVPIFFVVMGMRTDLRAFADPAALGLAGALIAAAILGKAICGLGALGRGIDRLSIGLGMVPRGEVGLIFANVGLTLTYLGQPIVEPATYSAVIMMVIVTTLVTPPALQWSLRRRHPAPAE
jgi:Kef-type K+ transport system membrane component KefB